jgi:hypothetical protein
MANVYVEPRPKGRADGSPIGDYVVEDHADHVLGTLKNQHKAIGWSKNRGHTPHVARVRHLNDKRKPDYRGSVSSFKRLSRLKPHTAPGGGCFWSLFRDVLLDLDPIRRAREAPFGRLQVAPALL